MRVQVAADRRAGDGSSVFRWRGCRASRSGARAWRAVRYGPGQLSGSRGAVSTVANLIMKPGTAPGDCAGSG
jgi:hypothetical protein